MMASQAENDITAVDKAFGVNLGDEMDVPVLAKMEFIRDLY